MRSQRIALVAGLALAYALALLGDQMLYVVLPSRPAAAGIATASLGIILSANRFVRRIANSLGGFLSAVGEGLLHPAVVAWTGDGAPSHLRGVGMGGLATAGDLSAALGPLVGYALLA